MLIQLTLDKLQKLHLTGMARALEQQQIDPNIHSLSFEDRIGLIVDAEEASRATKKLKSRLQSAKPRTQACLENLARVSARGLDKGTLAVLATSVWIEQGRNILISGPTGVGKTYLNCALITSACRNGHSALYTRSQRLLQDLTIARADGSYRRLLTKLARVEVLVIDDFGLFCMPDDNSRDLLEVIDDRSPAKPTIISSQLPLENWHQTISNPTIADAILDRVVHNSYKLILKGGSIRKSTISDTEVEES